MHLSTVNTFKHLNSNLDQMVTLDSDTLQKLHQVLLGIAEDVIDVCEQEHICYHLTGGSALGAVRYQGFIPWDDDLDIDIPSCDFNRFVQVFTRKYGNKYWVETYHTPSYGGVGSRIRQKGSIYRTEEDGSLEECGVFIDLVRIENTFNFTPFRWLHGVACMGFGFLLSCRNFYQRREMIMELARGNKENERTFRLKINIGHFLSFFSQETWAELTQRCYGLCKNNHSKHVTVPAGKKHYFGEMRLRKDFVETVDADFEGHKWKIPKDYDGYLKSMYGNYMEIPKEEDREKHVILEIKFPDEITEDEDKEKELEQPAISVIMPVYNTAAYLKSSISSVLRQTFSSFELILVNDASTDESRKICEKACAKDPRVRLLDCPEHGGVSHARNLGLEVAKGKYICFQDSDDQMHPQLLELMWQEAEQTQADLIMTDHWISDTLTSKAWRRLYVRPANPAWKIWSGEQVWKSWFSSKLDGVVWAKLFSVKATGDLRFEEGINHSEDWLFNYQFISQKPRRIAMTGFKGYYHIEKPDGLCHQATYDEFLQSMKIKRFVRDQEVKAGREKNALIAEQKIVSSVRDWLLMNPGEVAEHRNQLIRLLREERRCSPLYEKLSAYQKLLLFLSIYAMPIYRGLKAGKDHTLRFVNNLFSKT